MISEDIRDGVPYAQEVRDLARQAHRLLRKEAREPLDGDRRELRAVLQRIDSLRRQLSQERRSGLSRWLERLRHQVERFDEGWSSSEAVPYPKPASGPDIAKAVAAIVERIEAAQSLANHAHQVCKGSGPPQSHNDTRPDDGLLRSVRGEGPGTSSVAQRHQEGTPDDHGTALLPGGHRIDDPHHTELGR